MSFDNKISDVLKAVRSCLWDGSGRPTKNRPEYICQAVALVEGWEWEGQYVRERVAKTPVIRFLTGMGMPLSGAGFGRLHVQFYSDQYSQHLRLVWLDLAIQVAEEEGL